MVTKAFEFHETFAGNLAYKNKILWDAYSPQQFSLFRAKLNELFRDPPSEDTKTNKENNAKPENENKDTSSKSTDSEKNASNPEPADSEENQENPDAERTEADIKPEPLKKNKAMEKIREAVYKSTISQTKYTNKNLLATFILVTVAKGTTYLQAKDATEFSVHLVIRTRKCIKEDDSSDCCMVFIDEHGRVYNNWKHFMDTNLLPEGVALAPFLGIYKYDDKKLLLDSWETPASGLAYKIADKADVVAGVSGMAAAAVTLSALAAPVMLPAVAGAGIVCAATGVYASIRSGWQLYTRSDHEQSINITDQQARGCWLGVLSGAVAVSSAVATKTLAQVALAGKEASLIHETVVNGMNISTMLLSGSGVANGIVDLLLKFQDDEQITGLDYLQVAGSLAIFTHSVYNFRLASTIITQTQDAKVNSYRTELSNRQRKMFDKMYKETTRTQGAAKGKMDLIRLINEVPDNQYLNDLHKINKDLNKNNVRFSAGKDGHILLNEDVSVQSGVLRDSVQHGKGANVLGQVTKPIPQSHTTIPNAEAVNSLTSTAFAENSSTLFNYCYGFFNAGEIIFNLDTFQNCVQNLIKNVGSLVTEYLIKKANEFLQKFRSYVESIIKTKLYLENVLWDLYKRCEEQLIDFSLKTMEEKMSQIFEELLNLYRRKAFRNDTAKIIQCDVCKGTYQICSIE